MSVPSLRAQTPTVIDFEQFRGAPLGCFDAVTVDGVFIQEGRTSTGVSGFTDQTTIYQACFGFGMFIFFTQPVSQLRFRLLLPQPVDPSERVFVEVFGQTGGDSGVFSGAPDIPVAFQVEGVGILFIFATSRQGLTSGYAIDDLSFVPFTPQQQQFRVVARSLAPGAGSGDLDHVDLPQSGDPDKALNLALGEDFIMDVVQMNADGSVGALATINAITLEDGTQRAKLTVPTSFTHSPGLFPNNVLIQFNGSQAEMQHFLPVHSGKAVVSVAFTPQGQSARTVKVPVQVCSPAAAGDAGCAKIPAVRLGFDHNKLADGTNLDDLVLKFADLRGIPPQIVKAHIKREATASFDPKAYRYEPLTSDFKYFSAGQNLRVDRRFESFRLASFPDSLAIFGLPQGDLLSQDPGVPGRPANIHRREIFETITLNDAPVKDLFFLGFQGVGFQTLPTRNIRANDPPVSMENILFGNPGQNWIYNSCPITQSCTFKPSFLTWFRVRSKNSVTLLLPPGLFTGQPVLAASYGLMQTMYTTAHERGYSTPSGVGLPPEGLLKPSASVELGTDYVISLFRNQAGLAGVAMNPQFANNDDLQKDFGVALAIYNRMPDKTGLSSLKNGHLTPYALDILSHVGQYLPIRQP